MNALYSSTSALASAMSQAARAPETQNINATSNQEKPAPMYDLHHMSLNELKDMIQTMHADGSMNTEDAVSLSAQEGVLELVSGYPLDSKIDILGVMQQGIDYMKSQPLSTGIEYQQHLLDVLKGVDARLKANIPSFV